MQRDAFEVDRSLRRAAGPDARRAVKLLGVVVEKSKSSLLSSSIFCVRQMVLRVGFKFKLTMARVRTPAPSRLLLALLAGYGVQAMALPTGGQVASGNVTIAAPAGGSRSASGCRRSAALRVKIGRGTSLDGSPIRRTDLVQIFVRRPARVSKYQDALQF